MLNDEARRAQREQAGLWLSEHWTQNRECPLCGTDAWTVGDIVVVPLVHSPLDGPTYPFFPVFCDSCGHTRLFNALTMGILKGSEDEEEEEEVTIPEPRAGAEASIDAEPPK